MGKWLLCVFIAIGLTTTGNDLFAVAPVISYTPSTNVYTAGTVITTLTPTITNGVSAIGFAAATALTGATLSTPRGIGIDPSGNVYVANMGNNTISKYGPTGAYIGTFGTGATMSSPDYIVFDSSGNAYVLNLTTGTVFKYNSGGVYQSTIITGLSYALGMTIDASNNIYIADQGANAVKKYNTAGTVLLTLPNTNFSTPLGVAVDASGNIYVLNNGTGNNVTKYNSAGTFQSTFLSGFTSTQSIAIDGAGNFYIGDNAATNIINVYNQSGTFLTSRTATDPQGVAVDSKGDIFSSTRSTSLMSEFKPTGGFYLSGTLPAGLSFNSTTGAISGTPTATMATTVYTVTAYNASGSGSTTVTITVNNPTAPTGGGGSACSSGAIALTASGSTPAGGVYNWYAAVSGGASLGTGGTYTTPVLTATTTYYVDYTLNGATSTPRTAVTATINAAPVLATAPTTPTAGLYLSYPFTGNANDVSGNNNNGTLQSAPTLTTDRYGAANSAYSFNGSSQYVSTATLIASPGPQNFSISVWFKTSTAGGKLVGFGSSQTGGSGSDDRHIYMSNTGQVYFGLYPGSTKAINTTTTYADGNWHHVVATESTTNGANLYVDGALQATDVSMTTSQSYAGYWRVGYDNLFTWPGVPTDFYFTGSLDDVAIYNSELTASQVYTLYGGGSAPVCAGSTMNLQVNTVGGDTYSWSGPNGFTSASQNPAIANAAAINAGVYTVTVTAASGCTSQLSVTGVVNAAPSATFTATATVNVNASATITYTGTDPSTSTYSWDFNGGTPATGTGQGPFSVAWATTGTKTVTLNITNASGCSSSSTQNVVVSNATYGNYAFSDLITLNTTSLAITSNLTNFPALLSIQDNDLIISGTCADKIQNPNGPNYDFAFVSGGSELYYQVESYNQVTGTLLVWVQIPTLTYATNNTITLYFGSKTPTVTHNTAFFENTWANDYMAVFHFNETTYTGFATDGTAGGHTGTTSGMTSADLVTGKIGTAYSFNGSSKKITANAVSLTGTFTISAWVKLGATGLDQKVMTNQSGSGQSSGGYKLAVFSTNIPETEAGGVSTRGSTPNPTAFTTGTWHYIQGVYTGTTLSTYVDGTQYKILSTTSNPTAQTAFYVGVGEGGNTLYFNGLIDEPRVSNVAKTADWIKAEYGDQNNPTAFTGVGVTTTNTVNAAAISGALTYTWTGAASTDPAAAANWNNTTTGTTSQLPAFDGTATLVIPAGLANYPVLTANAGLYGLTIASGATLNLNGFTLSVGCNIYNNASTSGTGILYSASNSSQVTWNGTVAAQSYTGTNTTNTAPLGSMTVNNTAGGTVTINGGPVDIYSTLTITQGNLAVAAAPAALTLKSTATQSASVAAIPAGSSITGTVNVERYITGGAGYRGYRLISSPVYTATVAPNHVYSINYLQAGAFLTGSAGGGFDKTGNPTIYLYREDQAPNNQTFTTGNFWGISAINNVPAYNYYTNGGATTYNIPIGNGIMFFFRGNRTSALVGAETVATYVPVTVTMSASGTLNQGQVIVHDWYTPASANIGWTNATANTAVRGFNLVGNPYASSIDWEQYNTTTSTTGIYANNVGTTIYELNPATNNYDTYKTGGTHTNHGSRTIASGQAFFVLATNNTAPQLIFNETAKTATQNTGLSLFMAEKADVTAISSANVQQHLRLQLAKDSIDTDDAYIGFNSAAKTQYAFNDDAPYKQGNGLVSLATISSDQVALAINILPLSKLSQTVIPLNVNAVADGAYKLNMTEIVAIPKLYEIWLMDAYKKDSLDIRHNLTYVFDLYKADTNSYGSRRFSLVIRQNAALGLHLLNFTATKTTPGAELVWVTENEANYTNFTVERSTDNGKTFNILGGFASADLGTYNFLDQHPTASAANKYRLKIEDVNGAISYSEVATLIYRNSINTTADHITVYPNPASSAINLIVNQDNRVASLANFSAMQMQSLAPGLVSTPIATGQSYNIKIISITGTVMISETSPTTFWQKNINNLLPGTYIMEVLNNSDKSLVGKSTFIKL